MINAKELRIGNKVNYRGIEIFVINILEDTINLDPGHPTALRRGLIPCSELNPIPLTPEILEACGFENESLNIYILKTDGFELSYDGETTCIYDPDFGNGSGIITNIKHLHQLQNLYFALTREELEIKQLSQT